MNYSVACKDLKAEVEKLNKNISFLTEELERKEHVIRQQGSDIRQAHRKYEEEIEYLEFKYEGASEFSVYMRKLQPYFRKINSVKKC